MGMWGRKVGEARGGYKHRATPGRLAFRLIRGVRMRRLVFLLAVFVLTAPRGFLAAQQPTRADSTADTTRVTELPELNVTVARTTEPLNRVPFATAVLDRAALQRGQQ